MTTNTANMRDAAEVAVVGAGPVGLLLALELHGAGVDVLVLEQRTEIDPTVKAGSVGPLATEALHRRGLREPLQQAQLAALVRMVSVLRTSNPELDAALAQAEAEGATPEEAVQRLPLGPGGSKGHFAGMWVIDPTRWGGPEDSAREAAFISQQELEAALNACAAEAGIRVERGVAVSGLRQHGDGVELELDDGSAVRAGWAVGCDGGRSLVRKLAGFGFPGTEPVMTAYQVVGEYENPDVLLPHGWRRTETGMMAFGPTPGRLFLARFDGPPADRDAPITVAEVQAAARHVTGTEVVVTALSSATRFTDNARLADDYRAGRVLLAGDAAHVHSPFGGQGLNLGLLDAVNLGWKLAAEVRGRAPEGLLDSYAAERRPVAERVLENTRAQIALMRPDPHSVALRTLFEELLVDVDGANALVGRMVTGVELHHPMPYPAEPDELLGRPLADVELADGSHHFDHARPGRGLLLGTDPGGAKERVDAGPAAADGRALLVRPDGIVAWTSASGEDALDAALAHWFGAKR